MFDPVVTNSGAATPTQTVESETTGAGGIVVIVSVAVSAGPEQFPAESTA